MANNVSIFLKKRNPALITRCNSKIVHIKQKSRGRCKKAESVCIFVCERENWEYSIAPGFSCNSTDFWVSSKCGSPFECGFCEPEFLWCGSLCVRVRVGLLENTDAEERIYTNTQERAKVLNHHAFCHILFSGAKRCCHFKVVEW